MSCENLSIPKPLTGGCPTSIFGIPWGNTGRVAGNQAFEIQGIVLHCEPSTISELCNEMRCRTKQSVMSGTCHNSYHYGVGITGSVLQFVNDQDISWAFGAYKNNSYASPPPPACPVNWPVLQGINGLNVTPDAYVLNVALAIGHKVDEKTGCYKCETCSGLPENQHGELVQLLAYLAQEYNIPIDSDHITWHDLIRCDEGQECACTDLECLLVEVAAYCPPCQGDEAPNAPEAQPDDDILYIMGITEACCPDSVGCYVKIPWNGCFIGDLAEDGDLTSYILGLSYNEETGQWCLTRGCLGLVPPLIGCGTTDDPLRLDPCLFDDWITNTSSVQRVLGIDDEGCLTLQDSDSFMDEWLCQQPENSESIPEWVLAKTDETCPEWVTMLQVVEAGLSVADTDCLHLEFNGGVISGSPIISPDPGNLLICGQNGLYVPDIVVEDTDCVDLTYDTNTKTLSADLIVAPTQGGIPNALVCIPGQGAYVPELTCDVLITIYDTGINIVNLHGDDDGGSCGTETLRNAWDRMFCEIETDPLGVPMWLAGITELDECPVMMTPESIVTAGFSVQDTDCINLDFTGNILTATPAISVDIGGIQNVLECLPSGLYVPRGANANTEGPITGTGSDIDPIDIDLSQLDPQDLCDLGGIIPQGDLVHILGLSNTDCVIWGLPEDIVEAGLLVTDTNCVDLTLVGNVLSADVIVDPAVDNMLVCGVNGLYVPETAVPVTGVADTNCIDLTLAGGIVTANPIINPAPDNILQCTVSGLYVPLTSVPVVDVDNTNCIELVLAGGVLTANPIINPAADNQLQCLPGGLYVPPSAAGITPLDGDCTVVSIVGSVLTVDVVVDPDPTNILQCTQDGLFVPPSASGISVQDTNCINLNLTAGGVLTADPIIAGPQAGVENALACIPGQGLYVPECNWIVLSDNDCNGGVGANYMVKEFVVNQDTCEITFNSDPVHMATQASAEGPTTERVTFSGVVTDESVMQVVVNNPSPCRSMLLHIVFTGYDAFFSTNDGVTLPPYTFKCAVFPSLLINGVEQYNDIGRADAFIELDGFNANIGTWNYTTSGWTGFYVLPPGGNVTIRTESTVDTLGTTIPRVQYGSGSLSVLGVTI